MLLGTRSKRAVCGTVSSQRGCANSQQVPLTIRHAELGLSWSVLAVLEDWTTPSYHEDVGTPMETKRFGVRVSGPLPGRPAEAGEFAMAVRRYGDRSGWWMSPD